MGNWEERGASSPTYAPVLHKAYGEKGHKKSFKEVDAYVCVLNKKHYGLHCIRTRNLILFLQEPALPFPLLIFSTLSISDIISLCWSPIRQGMGEEKEKAGNKYKKLSKAERYVIKVKSATSNNGL